MKDQISALIDDETDMDDAAHLLAALKGDGELGRCWSTYHLIGDVMRGEPPLRPDFHQRLMQQLESEPTVLAPKSRPQTNKPSFWMSVAASVAAVMFVGWMALQQQAHNPSADNIAPALAQNDVSPESVNSYLLAHQKTFAGSGMQSAYYVRPVALSENGR